MAALSTSSYLRYLVTSVQRRIDRLPEQALAERLRALKDPLDLVHEAIFLILNGAERPQEANLDNLASFSGFVESTIQGLLNRYLQTLACEPRHVLLNTEEAQNLPSSSDASDTDSFSGTQEEPTPSLKDLAA